MTYRLGDELQSSLQRAGIGSVDQWKMSCEMGSGVREGQPSAETTGQLLCSLRRSPLLPGEHARDAAAPQRLVRDAREAEQGARGRVLAAAVPGPPRRWAQIVQPWCAHDALPSF